MAACHGWQGGDPSWLLRPDDLFVHRGRPSGVKGTGGRVPLPGGTNRAVRNGECKEGQPAGGRAVALSQGTLTWQDRP